MEAKRASHMQFQVMVDFMESHGDLSRPQSGAQARLKQDGLWETLANLLNSTGGGVSKSADKWKKTWVDWKSKTKKKYLEFSKHAGGTGGGPSKKGSLSELEERVLSIIGIAAVVGQEGIEEQGFNIRTSPPHGAPSPLTELTPLSPAWTPPTPTPPPPEYSSEIAIEVQAPPPLDSSPPPIPPARPSRRRPRPVSPSTGMGPRLRRGNRYSTPFERAAEEFAAVEQRRLALEEARDKWLHERLERMESEHSMILQQLIGIGQQILNVLSK